MLSRVGMSRHSALSVARGISTTRTRSVGRQAAALVIGSALIGLAVSLLVEAQLGLAPYDVLSSGLSERLDLSLGQASWTIAAALLLAATLLRRPPSGWGLAYVFLNGVAIDAASGLLQRPSSIAVRLVFVFAGIVVMAAGINVVVHSGTTGGPFELLMAAGEDRGVARITVRYILDIGVLVGGILLGGTFGPASILYGLLMGLTLVALSEAIEDYRFGKANRRTAAIAFLGTTTASMANDKATTR